jgi:hypothetical protein
MHLRNSSKLPKIKEEQRRLSDSWLTFIFGFSVQSPVCLKHLAFELLELLVLSAFPELDGTVRKWHEDKQQFCAQ